MHSHLLQTFKSNLLPKFFSTMEVNSSSNFNFLETSFWVVEAEIVPEKQRLGTIQYRKSLMITKSTYSKYVIPIQFFSDFQAKFYPTPNLTSIKLS